MQTSLDYRLPSFGARRFIREHAVAESRGPGIAFVLLIGFLLMMYSSISIVYPQLEAFRPTLLIAVGAIGMLIVELAQSRQRLRFMWPQGVLIATFLGAAVLSSFGAMYSRLAFNTTSDLAKIVLIYIVIENTVTNENRLRKILLTLVVGALFPAIGTINNYLHGVLDANSRAAWKGVFANPNENAYALAMVVPIAILLSFNSRWPMRLLLWGIVAVYVVAIFVTFSRGGILGLLAVAGLVGWKQKSFLVRVVMIGGLLASLWVGAMFWARDHGFQNVAQDTTVKQRMATIVAGGLMFLDYPVLGVGPNCSQIAYPLYVPKTFHCGCQTQLVIHNSFMQVLSEMGVLGFVPFMLLLGMSLFDARRMQAGPLRVYSTALEIALWGFVVCSLSGGFTYTWWPYLIFGLIVAAKHINQSAGRENPA